MMYNRGNRRDFDHWAELGNAGWSYEDVLPYFKKSENNRDPDIYKDTRHHSRGGYLDVERFPYQDKNVPVILEAFQEIGYSIVDINSENVTGVMRGQFMQSQGARQSTNAAFITPVRQRENLKVVTNVRVTKVLIHPDTKLAYGVAYAIENNRTIMGEVFAKKEVILSAGVFNSPHLLLLSGVGPRETLKALKIQPIQNLEVGYNLQDHILLPGIFFNLKKESQFLPHDMNILEDGFLYCQNRINSPWSGFGVAQTYANVKSEYANKNNDYPDLLIMFLPFLSCTHKAYPVCYYDSIRMYSILLQPKTKNFLTINTTDPFVSPLIHSNYLSNTDDIDILIDSYDIGKTLAETTAFSKAGFMINTTYIITKEDMENGTFTPRRVLDEEFLFTSNHHVGTNKMGPETDSSAVVSPELKVHGVRGLRVADASIMPRIVSGNPTATCIMIGEKVSDLIKETYK
ncbi:glucose dehydrogenase [FAD, quinone]-like [Periplaneta americana]|uniref:glucose dehydrogenase [FAD, quinone]-like n=1 Tax=Periplaneta americana TaxID=6978 RepID=UPI0037E8D620